MYEKIFRSIDSCASIKIDDFQFNTKALDRLKIELVPTNEDNVYVMLGWFWPIQDLLKDYVGDEAENVGDSGLTGCPVNADYVPTVIEILAEWGWKPTVYDECNCAQPDPGATRWGERAGAECRALLSVHRSMHDCGFTGRVFIHVKPLLHATMQLSQQELFKSTSHVMGRPPWNKRKWNWSPRDNAYTVITVDRCDLWRLSHVLMCSFRCQLCARLDVVDSRWWF